MKLVILAIMLVSVLAVSAHGTGASWETTVGDYLIDIGYDPAEIIEKQPVVFDFAISQNAQQ